MLDVFSIWNWVGAGTGSDPYRVSHVPMTLQGKARAFLGNLSCYDGVTGLLNPGGVWPSGDLLPSAEVIADLGNGQVVIHSLTTPEFYQLLVDALSGHVMFDSSLDGLTLKVESLCSSVTSRLRNWKPTFGWDQDVIAASVEVIDILATKASSTAELVHAYYSEVIDPAVPTPEFVDGFFSPDFSSVNLPLLQSFDVSDTLSSYVRIGDLGFISIVANQAVDILPSVT